MTSRSINVLPALLLAALVLRLAPLGRYVTPDEPAWVYRAIRFADALAARDWAAVPSTGHPGVTTMWLGAAGVAAWQLLEPQGSAAHLEWIRRLAWLAPENGEAFRHLAFFLSAGRVAVALTCTLALLAAYALMRRLFDRPVALLATGLLAFDPFLVGHSGLLHTDALQAIFSGLSILCLLLVARGERRAWAWSLASGAAAGLALLSKSLAAFLLPFACAVLGSAWLIGRLRLARTLGLAALWALSCAAIFAGLYPATWGAAWQTLRDLFGAPAYQSTTALMPTFFAGQTALRHGPEFYALALPFRLSPPVLVGLVLSVRTFLKEKPLRPTLAWLWLFVLGYTLFLALNIKKYDRYLLPVVVPATLAAALSLGRIGESANQRISESANRQIGKSASRQIGKSANGNLQPPTSILQPLTSILHSPFSVLLVVLQLLLLLPFAAYPLTAFSPLLGGPWVGARVFSADWGEGMGAATRWLNGQPNADHLTVAASSVPSFAPLFRGRTVPLEQATLADYVVLPSSQAASTPSVIPSATRPFASLRVTTAVTPSTPPVIPSVAPVIPSVASVIPSAARNLAHVARLGFLDHAVVITNTAPLEQAAYVAAHAGPADLIVLDAATPLLRHYAGPGRLAAISDLPDRVRVTARLNELAAGRTALWLVADPAASPISAAQIRQGLEEIATPIYTTTVASATITEYVNPKSEIPSPKSRVAAFGEHLTLVDVLLPTGPVNSPFSVFLRWQVAAPTPSDLHVSLQLRDAAGHLWADVGQLVLNQVFFPTSAWAAGEWADNVLSLKPPGRIPPGRYTAQLIVADSTGAQVGSWDTDGQFRGVRFPVGEVEIAPPAEPVGAASCAGGRSVAAGQLVACIPELPPLAVPSGDVLTLDLTWSATTAPQSDYRVRWRLLDTTDSTVLEQTGDLSPYATRRWRAGDSFEARYDLRLDPALSPGRYQLALNVLAPDGRPLWARDETLTAIEVLPRERLFELPADIAHPLDLALSTASAAVHLQGFDLAPAPETVLRPGDALSLTLYWQAAGPTEMDYKVFVHLVGPDGHLHGQVDHFPGGGSAPTTSWAPGQVIVDEVILQVAADAPAGGYYIAVGMYDATSGGRLSITDASGHLLPNNQVILPIEITVAGGEP